MSRTSPRTLRQLAAGSAALLVLAAASAAAQTTDSTRTTPPDRPMRGGMRGMGPRMAPDAPQGPRAGMPGRRLRGSAEGRFTPRAPGMGAAMRAGPGRGLMRGITLSPDQERALRASQSRHLLATKPLLIEALSARTDVQLAQLNGDQRALDAANTRLAATRARLDSLRAGRSPVNDLRAVLTSDQQKLLDRNLSEGADRARAWGMRGDAGRRERGVRPGMEPRGFRQGPPAMRRWGGDEEDLPFDAEPAALWMLFGDVMDHADDEVDEAGRR